MWAHMETKAESLAYQRKLITTVMIPVIYNWGLRFSQASKHKENLAVLNFIYNRLKQIVFV